MLLQAASMKPTHNDVQEAALANGEAKKSSETKTETVAQGAAGSKSPTVVYVNPPAAPRAEPQESGGWSRFLSTSLLAATFATGLSSFARSMDWSRELVDPGAKVRELEAKRLQEEAVQKVTQQAETNQVLLRQQLTNSSNNAPRYIHSELLVAIVLCAAPYHCVLCVCRNQSIARAPRPPTRSGTPPTDGPAPGERTSR